MKKKYSVNYWGSDPRLGKDEAWSGSNFSSLEEAQDAFGLPYKSHTNICHELGELWVQLRPYSPGEDRDAIISGDHIAIKCIRLPNGCPAPTTFEEASEDLCEAVKWKTKLAGQIDEAEIQIQRAKQRQPNASIMVHLLTDLLGDLNKK